MSKEGRKMMSRGEKAKALFLEGYNCAQSVTIAFAEDIHMSREEAARMSSAFGAGVGRLREICGCISGMALVAGQLYGYSAPEAGEEKAELYALIQELAGEFQKRKGSILCRELLAGITDDTSPTPEARTKEYYERRPCPELVAAAAEILDEKLAALRLQAIHDKMDEDNGKHGVGGYK